MRLFGPGEEGVPPTLAPKRSTNGESTTDALGFTINLHTKRISFPRESANDMKRLLLGQWPVSRRRASEKDFFSVAGTLWKITYVVRAGKDFVKRLVRLKPARMTGLKR